MSRLAGVPLPIASAAGAVVDLGRGLYGPAGLGQQLIDPRAGFHFRLLGHRLLPRKRV